MIHNMSFIALLAGFIIATLYLRHNVMDYILTVFYFFAKKSPKEFAILYDNADDEVTYKFIKNHDKGIKKYADFLRIHQEARESSYKYFRNIYDGLVKLLLYRFLPIVLIPAILFWSNWSYYLIGMTLVFLIVLIYKLIIKQHRIGFHQRLMISTIIGEYLKEKNL